MSVYAAPGLADLSPVSSVLWFLSQYGWWLVGGAAVALWVAHALYPHYERYRLAKEDAEYHKDPDVVLQRMEAIQRARERQQERLLAESARAAERQREREERKREEVRRLLSGAEGGGGAGGSRLGSADPGYLPLSGSAGGSNYRPPKKSKCGGGGCGR